MANDIMSNDDLNRAKDRLVSITAEHDEMLLTLDGVRIRQWTDTQLALLTSSGHLVPVERAHVTEFTIHYQKGDPEYEPPK